jgi:NAD(P)-dependent dehydrogenase (short-subunit alcohol dehydrogenase family)
MTGAISTMERTTMKTALITGANRGIGLALCKTYLAQGWKVIGLCRTASPELTESGARVIAGVDVRRNSPIHWTVNRLIC